MKQALQMEISARRKAEDRYAAEMQRRIEAERTIAKLTEENGHLEREARAWTNAVAEAIAPRLGQSMASSPERPSTVGTNGQQDSLVVSATPSQAESSRAVSELLRERVPAETAQECRHLEMPTSVSAVNAKPLNVLERAAGILRFLCFPSYGVFTSCLPEAVQDFFAKLVPMSTKDQA